MTYFTSIEDKTKLLHTTTHCIVVIRIRLHLVVWVKWRITKNNLLSLFYKDLRSSLYSSCLCSCIQTNIIPMDHWWENAYYYSIQYDFLFQLYKRANLAILKTYFIYSHLITFFLSACLFKFNENIKKFWITRKYWGNVSSLLRILCGLRINDCTE